MENYNNIEILKLSPSVNIDSNKIGVIVARFQVPDLHLGHQLLINTVSHYHKQVIVFLGVANGTADEHDPLDFATRKSMVQALYPNVVVLPQRDVRDDNKWSSNLDAQIALPFGESKAILYGSRDSFMSHYSGKHETVEVVAQVNHSGTELRNSICREVVPSSEFRRGIIYQVASQRAVTYPTVDVVAYNEKGEILLCKKPNEKLFRFIGGFVDRTDLCYEHAARREFMEESNGCEIGDIRYVASGKINDWRYAKSKSGIMTTLFIGKFMWGSAKPTDDIEYLEFINVSSFDTIDKIKNLIMPEHIELMIILIDKIKKGIIDISK